MKAIVRARRNYVNLGRLYSIRPWECGKVHRAPSRGPRKEERKGSSVRGLMNYVNLGRLYSLKPWQYGKVPRAPSRGPRKEEEVRQVTPQNSVNLGRLYTPIRGETERQPSGWAYFQDGSVFMSGTDYVNHEEFERHLNTAAHCLRIPTSEQDALKSIDSSRERLVITNKYPTDPSTNSIRYHTRKAKDGENFLIRQSPFTRTIFINDGSEKFPARIYGGEVGQWSCGDRQLFKRALRVFRGTLIGGKLQPNVRLGNGLHLNDMKVPEQATDAAQSVHHSVIHLLKAKDSGGQDRSKQARLLPPTTRGKPRVVNRRRTTHSPPTERRPRALAQVDDFMNKRVATLEARERAIHQRDEVLRWKRRVSELEQRLAEKENREIAPGQHADSESTSGPTS